VVCTFNLAIVIGNSQC